MTNPDTLSLPDPRTRPTIPVPEAGRLLGLARASAYDAVHRGELPVIRVGRRLLVPTAALLRLLQVEPQREPTSVAGGGDVA